MSLTKEKAECVQGWKPSTPILEKLTQNYLDYVDTFRSPDGTLEEMLQLKLDHTFYVVNNACKILKDPAFPSAMAEDAEACALLHDTGRYSQLRKYKTFQDVKSVDHADQGVAVIREEGWLDDLPKERKALWLAAVQYHNKREVPSMLDADTASLTHLVRDADKLDIFRVMRDSVQQKALEEHPEIAWGLPLHDLPSQRVLDAVAAGQSIQYAWIHSLSDFLLIEIGWLNGGLHYQESMNLAEERKVLPFLYHFVRSLTNSPEIDRVCRLIHDKTGLSLEE